MKCLNGKYYVEVNDKKYIVTPTENIILRGRKETRSLRTQSQVSNETKIRRNPKIIKDEDGQLQIKCYRKRKSNKKVIEKPKIDVECSSCKQRNWIEFVKGYYCPNCENIFNRPKHRIGEKVLLQYNNFSTRLPHANRKMEDIYFSMMNIKYESTEDMIEELRSLKGKTELKFYKSSTDYYDQLNYIRRSGKFESEEDPFGKGAPGVAFLMHEALLLMIFFAEKTSN